MFATTRDLTNYKLFLQKLTAADTVLKDSIGKMVRSKV